MAYIFVVNNKYYYSNGTTDTHKLFNALHTKTILSIVGVSPTDAGLTKLIGKVLIRIEYLCLVAPITRSTCILTLARWRVSSMSFGDSCKQPFVKAGIFKLACILATSSAISNPLSASTMSPGSNLLKNPELTVKCLSLTLPPQA